ncbi:MAG: hypothetical protein AAFQ68_01715 [Bacteroidota bacterium]
MPTRLLRSYLPVLILLGLGIWILDLFFGQAVWDPNEYFLGGSYDGLKNYFTPSWFVKYDAGTHFSGMNYPFGEHVSFTDNQPLFSWLINLVDDHIYPIADHTVAVLNSLVLWSLILGMLMLYKIGRHYGLPAWYAVPVAIVLALLSPQIHRFAGHYALAYVAYLPILWWSLIRMTDGPRPWWATGGSLLWLFLGGLIHPYYLLMGSIFGFAFLGLQAIPAHRGRSFRRKKLIQAVLVLLLPLIVFQIFMAITDPVTDRPPVPSGFFYYRARLEAIFLPVQGALWEAWHRFVYERPRPEVEAFSYVGFTATWVAILTLWRMGKLAVKSGWKRMFVFSLPGTLRPALWASVLVLIFALAIPFRWNMEFLLDILTPLRQFRSLGRFSWVFYYVFTMYAAVYLYRLYRLARRKNIASMGIGIILTALILWGFEAAIHLDLHANVVKNTRGDNIFYNQEPNFATWLEEEGSSVDEFQAVMPIPYFLIGSDKFVPRWQTGPSTARVFKLAFDTGLPMVCGSMSRTSFSQTVELLQLMSGPHVDKPVLDRFENQKDLLILHEFDVPISLREQNLLKLAELIVRKDRFGLFRLPLAKLRSDKEQLIGKFEAEKDSLREVSPGLFIDQAFGEAVLQTYDQGQATAFGEEIKSELDGDQLILYEGQINDTMRYHASAWMMVPQDIAGLPIFFYQEFDAKGKQVHWQEIPTMFGMTVYDQFTLVEHYFQVKQPGNRVKFYLKHRGPKAESFLLRPEGSELWWQSPPPHRLMYNNYYLE